MKFKRTVHTFIAVLISLIPLASNASDSGLIAKANKFGICAFEVDSALLSPYIPKKLKLVTNEKNKSTVILELYETESTFGIAPYLTAFMVVEVDNFPSVNGTHAHYPIWGVINNVAAQARFNTDFGFNHRYEKNIIVEFEKYFVLMVGNETTPALTVTLEQDTNNPVAITGDVNMIGVDADDTILVAQVPYISKGYGAKLKNIQLNKKYDDALAVLTGAAPLWGMVSKQQIFAYGKPEKN